MTRTEEFERLRPLLFAIAHRILGNVNEAQDAVEATGLRWADTPTRPASIESHLAAEVTRISIDALRCARLRREEHVGPWPAEPLLASYQDPDRPVELADSLLTAALLVLERLSPLERAVFVLHEAFGCSVAEIASAVGCSQEACRQLVAAIAVTSDGGSRPLPWPTYITGTGNVTRLLGAIVPPLLRVGVTLERRVNGRPGSVFRDRNGKILNALALDACEGRLHEIHLVINPDLAHADPVAEAYAVLRKANRAH
ncbi:sigma factor-like helix-turn-helix DNA-binding protein [Streptomyces sp. NBC_01483]|uniref:sigma factor-like helix-turn-helix DNA-binding protein n=1 Tax=Streptomyces sp. NBC_01483 TaxID=2903883 RepID=UPI002E37A27A|nr:sigma factor-like helix-turn-helix DNA-binding protein [Streptomyces sp. NBC_01483]